MYTGFHYATDRGCIGIGINDMTLFRMKSRHSRLRPEKEVVEIQSQYASGLVTG